MYLRRKRGVPDLAKMFKEAHVGEIKVSEGSAVVRMLEGSRKMFVSRAEQVGEVNVPREGDRDNNAAEQN